MRDTFKYLEGMYIQYIKRLTLIEIVAFSATLFYIVKGTEEELQRHVRKKIISTLLNGMSVHKNDETMMRNGCLTLCQFKIPVDVVRASVQRGCRLSVFHYCDL